MMILSVSCTRMYDHLEGSTRASGGRRAAAAERPRAAALRSSMTVSELNLREPRSRTVKASERVALDIVRDIVLGWV